MVPGEIGSFIMPGATQPRIISGMVGKPPPAPLAKCECPPPRNLAPLRGAGDATEVGGEWRSDLGEVGGSHRFGDSLGVTSRFPQVTVEGF